MKLYAALPHLCRQAPSDTNGLVCWCIWCFYTDAVPVLGLTDPRLCYLLDGFLFIYAVVMTALFVKAKVSLSKHWCIWLWWCKQVGLNWKVGVERKHVPLNKNLFFFFFFWLGWLDMLTSNRLYYFLLPTGSADGCYMELRDFLYLNFRWVKLELQFLFRSVGLVWNRVCKNGNCSLSESQPLLLTQVTKPTFSLLQSWRCPGRLHWLYFCLSLYCHIAN